MVKSVFDVLCGDSAEFCSFDVGDVLVMFFEEFYGFNANEFSFSVKVSSDNYKWVFLNKCFKC